MEQVTLVIVPWLFAGTERFGVGISIAATRHPTVPQLSCHHAAVTAGAWLCHLSARWAQVRWKGHAKQEGRGGPSPSMGTGVLAFYILIILTFNASQLK